MDDVDIASQREQVARDEALARRKLTIKACGWCHNCSESIGSGEIFCSKDCAEDWQKRQDARTRNGVFL